MFPSFINDMRRAASRVLTMPGDQAHKPSPEELADWGTRARDYATWWELYNGDAAQEFDTSKTPKDGRYPYKWPLQINPIGIGCRIHQQALLGQIKDPANVPAPVTLIPTDPASDASIAQANKGSDALRQVEYENKAATIDAESMVLTQIYGGVVHRVCLDNSPWLPSQIRIERLLPEECWFRWAGSDFWHPTDAWLRRDIDVDTARTYGVTQLSGDIVEYLEHWSATERHITVDGHPAFDPVTHEALYGPNPYGFVNFVYIPHIRSAEAWGESLVSGASGLFEELNNRMADIGDSAYLSVHEYIWGHSISSLTPKKLPDNRVWLDAGKNVGRSTEPLLSTITRQPVSESLTRFVDMVLELLRLQLMTSNPAYGKLEGTQRSGQTVYSLNDLMYGHVDIERLFWTQGLMCRAWMVLKLLALQGLLGVTDAHVALRQQVTWQPKVAVDRAALVNELTTRIADGTVSPESAMETYGDIPNVESEREKVVAWKKELSEMQAVASPFGNPGTATQRPPVRGQGA